MLLIVVICTELQYNVVVNSKMDDKPLHVDIPARLKERLDRLAHFDGHKLRWLVEELVRIGLEHYREQHPRLISNGTNDPAIEDDRSQYNTERGMGELNK
jgi:hypothetical protein